MYHDTVVFLKEAGIHSWFKK